MGKSCELVLDAKATLGEGPCWDSKKQCLYWVDILGKKVHKFDPKADEIETFDFDQFVGAVVLDENGNFILAMQNGIYSLDLGTKELVQIVNPEAALPNNRFNDGKCDPHGRFWAGTMALDDKHGAGSLYCMDTDRSVKKVVAETTISNGLAWSPDNSKMYFIDTPTGVVKGYDYDINTGEIANGQIVVKIPEGQGGPDGMTIDSEGMLWVAHWGGYKVSRWNPNTGEQIDEINVPARQVTSCAFGGADLDELYITTARVGLSDEELEKYPLSGGLFKAQVGIKGTPSNRYKG
jgi:sugar lactone lactonase YvrE